jgi:hypothetical protein
MGNWCREGGEGTSTQKMGWDDTDIDNEGTDDTDDDDDDGDQGTKMRKMRTRITTG